MSKNEKDLLEIVEENEKEIKDNEEKNIEPKEEKKKTEKFLVVKIINEKAVMVRSQKTSKLFSRENKNYKIGQLID